ncbi:MAG: Trk system potassium transporter TrkA [Clostridiales Family XIII bacterium]|jgi:trk system potassium uptake protein TrkA|nr:Trk system potassium transporter TrkA [Clostridiales Family XIII bacterium]
MKIAIVGAGKLGLRIAELLMGGDHSVTIIDKSEETINRYAQNLDVMSVVGNGKEITLLSDLGIDTYDYLIATTDRDEKNIVITSIAKALGVSKVIARIRDPEHLAQRDFLKRQFSIDHVVNPDLAVAEEIHKYLVEKYTLSNGIYYAGKISMLEFLAGQMPKLVGLTTEDATRVLGNVTVAAVSRNGKVMIPAKGCPITIEAEDDLYIVGERDHIEGMSKKVFERGKYTNIQRVMIVGGGKSGFYLAKLLEDFGAAVKIIDINKARCQYLSIHLQNVLVLHGDATDLNFLHEENFDEMDAFVSTTGFDEENLLLALMAKQAGIEDVIAKISRESFSDLIQQMGVDMALNPIDIEASHVQRFLQGSRIIASQVIQGQAELLLISLHDDMVIADKRLSSMNIPEGLLVTAIQRGAQVIIPDRETVLKEGDRILLMSELSEADDVEKFIKTKRGLLG